jgi:hypothetical protein
MFAQITSLRYWKSEHDETMCEDVCAYDSLRGIFAIADGAGTTLFSNIWAKILVSQFLAVPLLSNDPFEVEWWVRRVQHEFRTNRESNPALETLAWNALQKIHSEGSQSTLATLRLSRADITSAQAELLAFGDSCIFIARHGAHNIRAFPLEQEAEFDRAPICIPSSFRIFNRHFHRGLHQHIELRPGDTVVLATDAVARWIVSAGGGRYATPFKAFQEVIAQTSESWADFIEKQRSKQRIIDDDCTALIIKLFSQPRHQGSYLMLGSTPGHADDIREERKRDFEGTRQAGNKELVAIYYGDGEDLRREGIELAPQELQDAQHVADALREVLSTLHAALNRPDLVARVQPVWQKYAPVLETEPCAERLRQTLRQLGVIPAPARPQQSAQPATEEPTPGADPMPPAMDAPGEATAAERAQNNEHDQSSPFDEQRSEPIGGR